MENQTISYYRYIAERIKEYAGDRKVVFYGNKNGFANVFEEVYGSKPAFHVTALKDKVSDDLHFFDEIKNKSD